MSAGYYEFTVGREENGVTVRTFLRQKVGLSARLMTVMKYHGGRIAVGGRECKAGDVLREADVVTLRLPHEEIGITPVGGDLDILWEDDCLLVVNKPAGMPVHPTKSHQLDTLANIVAAYQKRRAESYTFRAMNRLDRDTSGCVLIAKDRIAYTLTQPTVRKTYLAVCEGTIDLGGTVNAPISLAKDSKIRRCVSDGGSQAITHYQPLCRAGGHTLCLVRLETGRTHQIRCHMSDIGHPLAGDDLYGGSLGCFTRQALHCCGASFRHPVTRQPIALFAALPDDFVRAGFDLKAVDIAAYPV